MNILVRRIGALGDVILATPIVRRLRREYPHAHIAVETAYPAVFRNNPHVSLCSPFEGNTTQLVHPPQPLSWDMRVELDLAYETRPQLHIVDAYMEEAFGDRGEPGDRLQELFPGSLKATSLPSNAVAVHASMAGWRSRTLPRGIWLEVTLLLKRAGLFPILVGLPRDGLPHAACIGFHSSDLLAQAAVISACRAFVGSDSALLHVAGAMRTPVVGVFTCAKPELRLPQGGAAVLAVQPPGLDCLGCLHCRPPPVTADDCERGDYACVAAITPEAIVEAVNDIVAVT